MCDIIQKFLLSVVAQGMAVFGTLVHFPATEVDACVGHGMLQRNSPVP